MSQEAPIFLSAVFHQWIAYVFLLPAIIGVINLTRANPFRIPQRFLVPLGLLLLFLACYRAWSSEYQSAESLATANRMLKNANDSLSSQVTTLRAQLAACPKQIPCPKQTGINVGRDNNGIANNGPNYGTQSVKVVTPSRVLDDKQETKFSEALQGSHGGAWMFMDGTDSDVMPLATQLCRLFHAAHLRVNCVGVPNEASLSPVDLPNNPVGIHCYGVSDEIRKAFQDSGLACVNEDGALTFSTVLPANAAIVIGDAKKKN